MKTRATPSRQPTERGAGTVLVVGLCLVLVMLLAATVMLVQAGVAAARAAAAADLSALAAADSARGLRDGEPCEVAELTAAMHGARLASCGRSGPHGYVVEVHTTVETSTALPDATGRARAGPPPP